MRFSAMLASAALTLAVVATAQASSVVYIGADGNVHLVSPDGAVKHQVTKDATADLKYKSPSQTDAGRIVAIRGPTNNAFAHFLDRQTGAVTDNWLLPSRSGPLSFSPFSGGQISPTGGIIVYDAFYGPGSAGSGAIDVAFVNAPGFTNPCALNCHTNYSEPRWIPKTDGAGMIHTPFGGSPQEAIYVQTSSGLVPWVGLGDPNAADIETFDASRQNRLAIELTPDGAPAPGAPDPANLEVFSYTGTPGDPSGTIQLQCEQVGFAPNGAHPRWSPDGSMLAWEGAEGIYTSPAPTATGGGPCALAPKLVAPGGKSPDWGLADTPGSGNGGDNGDGGDGGDQGGDDNGPNGGSSALNLAGKQSLAQVAKSGKLLVEVACDAACEAEITALADKKTAKKYKTGKRLGKGSGSTASAGTFEVTVKLTKRAKKGLKKAKKAKATLEAMITEAGGAPQAVSETVTLKR